MSEKKYTQEEIRAIVDEAMRKANMTSRWELSASELEKVNAGTMIIPDTHEEIDQKLDIIQSVLDIYGPDVALITAQELGCLAGKDGSGRMPNPFLGGCVDTVRNWMHRELDGLNDGIGGHWETVY